jgi:hypothetical protein
VRDVTNLIGFKLLSVRSILGFCVTGFERAVFGLRKSLQLDVGDNRLKCLMLRRISVQRKDPEGLSELNNFIAIPIAVHHHISNLLT